MYIYKDKKRFKDLMQMLGMSEERMSCLMANSMSLYLYVLRCEDGQVLRREQGVNIEGQKKKSLPEKARKGSSKNNA